MSHSPDVPCGQAAGKRLALVIGVDQTRSSILPALKHAVTDAQDVADVLVQRCQFTLYAPPLLGEQATSASIKRAVLELVRQRSADDFLLLYFSGHGQQAYDELRQEIRHTYLGSADIKEEEVEEDPMTMHVSLHWLRERLFEQSAAWRRACGCRSARADFAEPPARLHQYGDAGRAEAGDLLHELNRPGMHACHVSRTRTQTIPCAGGRTSHILFPYRA